MTEQTADRWKFRRRAVFAGLGLLASVVVGLVLYGNPENSIHTGVLDDAMWAFVSILGLYLGAPVADDWLQTRKARTA
jgi:UDP-N-acetylmuramyl pentapeptide phosphotransferase/UDP-N-acetylglucosamine-1-phosphate transferase